MNNDFKKEERQEKQKIIDSRSFAGLSKGLLDQYFQTSKFEVWLFGSLLL